MTTRIRKSWRAVKTWRGCVANDDQQIEFGLGDVDDIPVQHDFSRPCIDRQIPGGDGVT